ANQRHWVLRKSDWLIHNCESIALQFPTARADRRPPANVDFHKEAQRLVFSTLRFARPTVPTCRADELYRGDASADASGVNRPSNISTNHGPRECRDRRQASRERARLNSPTRALEDETSERKAAAT